MQLYLGFLAIFVAITFPFNFSLLYRDTLFFQDYRQIVNKAFLNAEMQKILSLSEQEAQELQNSNLESLDGFAFSPINSWTREIWIFFHKSEIGDTDTLKLIFFAFSNNTFHLYFLLNFLFIKYRKYPTKIPKRILQTQWVIHSIPDKKYIW